MVFSFLIALFGFTIAIRTAKHLLAIRLLQKSELTKIGTAYFSVSIVAAWVFARSYLMIWVVIFTTLIVFVLFVLAIMHRRSSLFSKRLRESVTLLALKMKTGRSFRQSLSEVVAESDPQVRVKLAEIASVVVFSQQTTSVDPSIADVIDEFLAIDRTPHLATRRLAVFREKLRIEDDFRRRSGQVLARIRAQSLVMSGLYLAIFVFMIWKFGWRANANAFVASFLLFAAGGIWIWIAGRRLRWKV